MYDLFIIYCVGIIPAGLWLLVVWVWVDADKHYANSITLRQAYSIWNYKDDYSEIQELGLRPIFTSLLWLGWITIQIPVNLWMFIYSAPILFIIKLYETAPTSSIYDKLQNGIKFIFKGNT